MPERSKTPLAQQAEAKDLPRAICAGCQGYGSTPESLTCPFCAASVAKLCLQHRCAHCIGMGVTCPECRGMRMLSRGAGQIRQLRIVSKAHTQMGNSALGYCPHCMQADTEGIMRLNLPKQLETIRAYVSNPHTAYWDMRHQADAEKAAYDHLMRQTTPWRQDYASAKSFGHIEDRKRQMEVMKRRLNILTIGEHNIPMPEGGTPHAAN